MTQLESKDLASSLPLLPRLHRLDFLLQVLEEKHGLSGGNDKSGEEENIADYCKATVSLSSALEEAHHKGTLVERLTALENRLFKLSLEMDEGNTSRSRKDNEDEKGKHLQEEASIAEAASLSTGNTNRVVVDIAKKRRKSYKKWGLGCLRLGCN
ncbi:unnamed protein product [Withania somnifera]